MRIKYRAYVEGTGWQPYVYDGAQTGIVGKAIQQVQIQLVDTNDAIFKGYYIKYKILRSDMTSSEAICSNGETSGLIGRNAQSIYISIGSEEGIIKNFISQDTKWTAADGPHYIPGELIINQNVTLTIEPGAKVIFQKYAALTNGINVYGTLNASGSSASPITISYSEDGGVTNDNNYTFTGIEVKETGKFIANYINMSFKGGFNTHIYVKGAMNLSNSTIQTITDYPTGISGGILLESAQNITIEKCTISKCFGILARNCSGTLIVQQNKINDNFNGIYLFSNIPTAANITIKDNLEINRNKFGIDVDLNNGYVGKLLIENNKIDSSINNGIRIENSGIGLVNIIKNTITGTDKNRTAINSGPIYIYTDGIMLDNYLSTLNSNDSTLKNYLSGNNYDAIILEGNVKHNLTIPKGYNRYLTNDLLNIQDGTILTVNPGVIYHLRGSIHVNGRLNAQGTSSSPIIFTSINDAAYKLLHTNAPTSEAAKDNNFGTIDVVDGIITAYYMYARNGGYDIEQGTDSIIYLCTEKSSASLVNCEIVNSLHDGIVSFGNLDLINSKVDGSKGNGVYNCKVGKIIGSQILNSGKNGVNAFDKITIINSTIKNLYGIGVYFSGSDKPTIVSNTFQNNNTSKNSSYTGLFNGSNEKIDATMNYWGASSGPSIYDSQQAKWLGEGDRVGMDINYLPFSSKESWVDLGQELTDYINYALYKDEKHYGEEGVSPANGNFSKTCIDIASASDIFDIKLGRTYNSKDNDSSNAMGRGWRFNFQGNIKDYPNSTTPTAKIVKLPDGSVQTFKTNNDGTFTAYDSRNKLIKNSDGTYKLITKTQKIMNFNTSGMLVSIVDRNGNKVTINYDTAGKIDTILLGETGISYTIGYENNLIKTISEKVNGVVTRLVTYSYTNNLLTSATDCEGNIVANYEYDAQNFLINIKDSGKNLTEAVTYDHNEGANQHKVKTKNDAFGFISPTKAFSDNYKGVTVEFKLKPGTTSQLENIGLRNNAMLTKKVYPNMNSVSGVKGWNENFTLFKAEGNQINIGLGKGKGLEIFNSNIDRFMRVGGN